MADRKAAEVAISEYYHKAGLPAPDYVWAENPKLGVYCACLLRHRGRPGGPIGKYAGKAAKLLKAVAEAGKLSDPEPYELRDEIWEAAGSVLGGPRTVGSALLGDVDPVRGCSWFWPFADVAVLVDSPKLRLDADGHLHDTDGPALEYPDGWSIRFKHGEVQHEGADAGAGGSDRADAGQVA